MAFIIKRFIKRSVAFLYFKFFVKKYFYFFNRSLFYFGLRGMGILNYESKKNSGEEYFIKKIISFYKNKNLTVFDVGANHGDYLSMILEQKEDVKVYAFEPHPKSFAYLEQNIKGKCNVIALNKGCGNANSKMTLFDLRDDDGSELATLFKDVIETLHKSDCVEISVDIIKLDDFCIENNIEKINLLKIDTEGNELNVLLGSMNLLRRGDIDIIHFEFNAMNVISRSFFRDFYDLLDEYIFYRLLPDGMINLGSYDPILYEIFAFQNIVAVKKTIAKQFNLK